MHRIRGLLFIFMITFMASAQSISLNGTVKSESGKPIPGALVVIAGRKLADTTDAWGAYSIVSGTSIEAPALILPSAERISLHNGIVSFNLGKTAPVSIRMFDMKGNLLESAFDRTIPAGAYRFNLTAHRLAAKLLVLSVAIGGNVTTFRWLPVSRRAIPSAVSAGTVPAGDNIAELNAVVDSLIVTASGYMSSTKAISSYQGVVDITLDSIKLEKFSFFVTSLKALQDLSGSQDGFGGDFRFGKTGQGAGLLGADSICGCIAERSMPGSKVKQWRAFLSVTKGPDGRQVNAIDRIGTGPWYDRVGRLVSNSIGDLLHYRPSADPEIKNDLPNEDGIPNHRPDPAKPAVDNHQIITGSDTLGRLYSSTATCQDWTSNSDTTSKPRCGLSYPRAGIAIGVGGDPWAEWNGDMTHWISVWNVWGCKAGIDLSEASIRGKKGVYTIGNGGGYGGFYCFALHP